MNTKYYKLDSDDMDKQPDVEGRLPADYKGYDLEWFYTAQCVDTRMLIPNGVLAGYCSPNCEKSQGLIRNRVTSLPRTCSFQVRSKHLFHASKVPNYILKYLNKSFT